MDLTKMLAQLRLELEHIDAAIASLERLQVSGTRRGRPPRSVAELRKLKDSLSQITPPRAERRRS